MGKKLGMAIILCHQDLHATFDQQTTAETTGTNCKEAVNTIKLVTKHLPYIPSKRADVLRLLEIEEKDVQKKIYLSSAML
eukprot:14422219-Ditylum_brightwellii.AAC.1